MRPTIGSSHLTRVSPLCWRRTGPGLALDGKPRFNLDLFDEAYFDRLSRRVRAAREHGIYVSARLQERYVRQVIDTVKACDNVLYEICNEAQPESTEWQYHMIGFVRDYERRQALQHPVGMTLQHRQGLNSVLHASAADWISPGGAVPESLAERAWARIVGRRDY
jgi:hypothetical protein